MPKRVTEDRVRVFLAVRGIESFPDALEAAMPRPMEGAPQADKKNYAERLSKALAVLVANKLRPMFPSIVPLSDGIRLSLV